MRTVPPLSYAPESMAAAWDSSLGGAAEMAQGFGGDVIVGSWPAPGQDLGANACRTCSSSARE